MTTHCAITWHGPIPVWPHQILAGCAVTALLLWKANCKSQGGAAALNHATAACLMSGSSTPASLTAVPTTAVYHSLPDIPCTFDGTAGPGCFRISSLHHQLSSSCASSPAPALFSLRPLLCLAGHISNALVTHFVKHIFSQAAWFCIAVCSRFLHNFLH